MIKRNIFTCVALITVSASLFAQKQSAPDAEAWIDLQSARFHFNNNDVFAYNEAEIQAYLIKQVPSLQEQDMSIVPDTVITSPGGTHYTFHQEYMSHEIYRSQIKVSTNKDGRITSWSDFSFAAAPVSGMAFPDGILVQSRKASYGRVDRLKDYPVWFPTVEGLIPAHRFEVCASSVSYYEDIISADGSLIYHRDLLCYYAANKDSVVTALVFNPDPLTTAQVTYGAPYIDNNDNEVSVLNNELYATTITANYDTALNLFTLESTWVIITEHYSPVIQPATSTSPSFSFTRGQDGFEDVNCFYHLNTFQNYIQSLGFTNLVAYQIWADTHAWNGADQSSFNSSYSPPRLNFGEGGVDDAEDADVLLHEYGHAVSYSAAPGTNSGTERSALDEANGDYLASSYSHYLSPYNWDQVFTWDGHNPFWPGRWSTSTKHYPEDLAMNLYTDADIWSSTIMQIWEDIGRQPADAILFQSIYGYANNMTMADAASLYVQADSALYNGLYHNAICARFNARGLGGSNCVTGIQDEALATDNQMVIMNAGAFITGSGAAILSSRNPLASAVLYGSDGAVIHRYQCVGHQQQISAMGLPAGVYVLRATDGRIIRNFKLIRL